MKKQRYKVSLARLQSQALIRVGILSLLLHHLHFHFIVHLMLISSFRERWTILPARQPHQAAKCTVQQA